MSHRDTSGKFTEDPEIVRVLVAHLRKLGWRVEEPDAHCEMCGDTGIAAIPCEDHGGFYSALECPRCGRVAESNRRAVERRQARPVSVDWSAVIVRLEDHRTPGDC